MRWLNYAWKARQTARFRALHYEYRQHTMIPPEVYAANLQATLSVHKIPGCVIECGVWRGGMIAGIAELLGPDRTYHLFDSFEGLPDAKPIDGPAALAYQASQDAPGYFDNCRAELREAQDAMARAGVPSVRYHVGWFAQTLPGFTPDDPIALLRLDGDWFESTMTCLTHLVPQMAPGGLILVDDYYTWDGCCKAVHAYLAQQNLPLRIRQTHDRVCTLAIPHEQPQSVGMAAPQEAQTP